jgi:hypothetical protein
MLNNTAAWPISNAHAKMTAKAIPFANAKNETACIVDTRPTQIYNIANNTI